MGKVKLSIPQSKAYHSTAKSIGVVAGFGSGKTHAALVEAFKLLNMYPGVPVAYAGPTYQLVKDIWFPAVEEHCIEHGYKYDIHRSDYVINIHGLGNIICRSLSNPNKIIGWTCGDFLIDELDTLKTEDALNAWRKCKARCRTKFPKRKIRMPDGTYKKKRKPNQMRVYTTPEGFKATHNLFVDKPLKNSELVQMSTYSNQKNLPKDYIDELRANYPEQLINAYILGQFVNLTSGAVYPMFCRKRNNAPGVYAGRGDPLQIGMDFNVGEMAAVVHIVKHGMPIAVGELCQIRDTPAMIKAIKELYPGHYVTVYPDASGSHSDTRAASGSDLKLLREAGFYVVADPSNPRIKDRVLAMNAMFLNAHGERRYMINVDECPQYVKCLEQQAYDTNGLPDKQSGVDHLPDAGGYFIQKNYGINKPSAGGDRLILSG